MLPSVLSFSVCRKTLQEPAACFPKNEQFPDEFPFIQLMCFLADLRRISKTSSIFASQVDGGRGQVPDTVEDVEDLAERVWASVCSGSETPKRLGAGVRRDFLNPFLHGGVS